MTRLLLSLILLASACGAGAVAPTPTSTSSGIRACTASDVAMRFRGWNGATGSLQGTVGIGNQSATRCLLSGYPKVDLLAQSGDPLPLTLDQWKTFAKVADVVLEPNTGDVPAKGAAFKAGQGSFGLNWMNWCGAARTGSLRVTLLDRSMVIFGFEGEAGSAPRCDDASKASVLSIGPFEAAPQD